ncbi:MAG: hypothetical protein IPO13_02630 [Rhodocyclaceae bacterium]|nr:hypothetical protein [Rhodocyclaceae bacterium]
MAGAADGNTHKEWKMPDARELVTLSELSDRLTTELQKAEDAAGSKITVQYMLREPDATGCNWSDSVVLQVGPNASKESLAPYVAQLVQHARQRFNVNG